MGQKTVKFSIAEPVRTTRNKFIIARKHSEKNEHPKSLPSKLTHNKSEDSLPYPSSLSELYLDSDDLPPRKVKIRKAQTGKPHRHSKQFKQKLKQFEKSEYIYARSFKENHVKFDSNTVENFLNSEFQNKVKRFEKNESRVCLLKSIKGQSRKLNLNKSLSFKRSSSRASSVKFSLQSFRSGLYLNLPED